MPLSDSPNFDAEMDDVLRPDEPDTDNQPQSRRPVSRLRMVILGLVLVAGILAAAIFFAPGYGSVSGTVRDIDGQALQARVSIVGIAETIPTDANGRFLISRIPSGTHTLAIHYGSDDISFQIDVPKGGSFSIGQIQIVPGG